MAKGSCGTDAPFDRLPDEVVINIFSFVSFNELLDIIQNVCVRWKRLAHTPVLWFDKEYAIRGRRWRLQGRSCCGGYFSECMRCRCHKTDEEILQAVVTMPQLRKLTIMRAIKGSILRKICANCPNLTSLHIQASQKVNHSLMKYVFEKCQKIQSLTLPASIVSDRQCAEQLSHLRDLKRLIVYDDLRNVQFIRLSVVAAACPWLEEIHTDSQFYEMRDVEYFLKAKSQKKKNKRKQHCLTAATLPWRAGIMEEWYVVPLLGRCDTSLRKLQLHHFHFVNPDAEVATFEALSGLHSLQELHAERVSPERPQLLSLPFQPGCLTQLRRLQLQYASNLLDETVVAISRGCPKLCELRLKKSENITDAALSEIHRLKHLEILELSGCNRLGGAAMAHIAQLPALHTLVLQLFNDLAMLQPSLQQIVNMKELRCLDIFKSCNKVALPFDEFPGKLVKLRELRVTYEKEDKNIVTNLRSKMPHLKIFNTFWQTDDYFPCGIEMDDGEGGHEYYQGDDFYYSDDDDYDDDDDDDNDDDMRS